MLNFKPVIGKFDKNVFGSFEKDIRKLFSDHPIIIVTSSTKKDLIAEQIS